MAFQWRRFQFFDKDLLIETTTEPISENSNVASNTSAAGGLGARTPATPTSNNTPASASASSSSSSSSSSTATPSIFTEFCPSCTTSGRGQIIWGDDRGVIKCMNRDLEETLKWNAYEVNVLFLQQLKKSNMLISVGNDATASNTSSGVSTLLGFGGGNTNANNSQGSSYAASLKFWRLDKLDEEGRPLLARKLPIFNTKFPPVPITCFSALEDLSQIAVGLANGAVMLFDGNMLRDRNVKQTLIQREGKFVTGVYFREALITNTRGSISSSLLASSSGGSAADRTLVSLFVVTTDGIHSIFTKHPKQPRVDIDTDGNGAELGCSVLNEEKKLVVANKNAVFFYEAEEKREAYGFEGTKKFIHWFNSYLVLICENKDSRMTSAPNPNLKSKNNNTNNMASNVATAAPDDTLTIYDLKNKFIAFQMKFESLSLVVSEYGSLYLFTSSPLRSNPTPATANANAPNANADPALQHRLVKLYQLSEKDLPSKIDILFKKNLYPIAISLVTNSSQNENGATATNNNPNSKDLITANASNNGTTNMEIIDIFQKYGDHLYAKGDYDGAIQQYLETIRYVEPSYVIRKFLDAQRIHNLTRYLEVLHEKGCANKDHTTLLLNCYTKLKDVNKLDEFIRHSSNTNQNQVSNGSTTGNKFLFDVPTAIQVCRQAGYFQHALKLAMEHHEHESYISIQLDDVENYVDALLYIASLSFMDALKYMNQHGLKLMKQLPLEATQVLTDLCTEWKPKILRSGNSTSAASSSSSSSSSSHRANPDEFIHFFVGYPAQLEIFLESIVRHMDSIHEKDLVYYSSNHVAVNTNKIITTIYNTLLELYLRTDTISSNGTTSSSTSSDSTEPSSLSSLPGTLTKSPHLTTTARKMPIPYAGPNAPPHPNHHKIMALLKNSSPLNASSSSASSTASATSSTCKYEIDHALVLCQLYSYEKGVIYLYSRLKLYHEILSHYMAHQLYTKIIKTCRKYGNSTPQLWIQALSYFAQQQSPCEEEICIILEQIERLHLLPPLMVIQMLSSNPHKPLAVVKDFIIRALKNETAIIESDQSEISRISTETVHMREEIHRLHTYPLTFQGIKCHVCTSSLSLPAIHFLCGHSYHQRCINESENECPKCIGEYKKIREIKQSMKLSIESHDRFYKQLDDVADGFSTVAEYFGRGIFDQPKEEQKI